MAATSARISRMHRQILVDSRDPEELHRFWFKSAQPNTFEVLSDHIHASAARLDVGDSSIFFTQTEGQYRIRTVHLGDTFSIATLTGGTAEMAWEGCEKRTEMVRAGDVVLALPGTTTSYRTTNPIAITCKIALTSANLFRIRALPHARRVSLCGVLPREDAEDIFRLMNFLVDEIDRTDIAGGVSPQVMIVNQALVQRGKFYIHKTLGLEDHSQPGEVETVRQCDQVIQCQYPPISGVKDLVTQVSCSERQIYRAFDRVCDCTPSDYIRRSNLITARSQLEFPVGEPVSREEVAIKFGYKTFRHFKEDYLQEFGHEPRPD